jgi:hypothetical protein
LREREREIDKEKERERERERSRRRNGGGEELKYSSDNIWHPRGRERESNSFYMILSKCWCTSFKRGCTNNNYIM